jgi:hypothetical protein
MNQIYYRAKKKFIQMLNAPTLPEECQETPLERKRRLGREHQAKYR